MVDVVTIAILIAAAACLAGGVIWAYVSQPVTYTLPTRRALSEAAAIVSGWVAMIVVICFGKAYAREPPYLLWIWTMLAVAIVVGAATIMVVIDARRPLRVDAAGARINVAGVVFGAGVWLLGGLNLFVWFAVFSGVGLPVHCRLPGQQGESHCLTPGFYPSLLGVVIALSATPAMAVLAGLGWARSRVAAWLSPVIIVGLYVLARLFWGPRLD